MYVNQRRTTALALTENGTPAAMRVRKAKHLFENGWLPK